MFVSTFRGNGKTVADISIQDRAKYGRASFTEIDHGYVNPATDRYTAEVNQAMPDIKAWNSTKFNQEAYATPYETFNEYMTFAAYSLFLSETLSEEDQEDAIKAVESVYGETFGALASLESSTASCTKALPSSVKSGTNRDGFVPGGTRVDDRTKLTQRHLGGSHEHSFSNRV